MKEKYVITIGRQYGSGGREIGKKLSEILGIQYYDKKLISEAAKRSGLSSEMLQQRDEKAPGGLMHALSLSFGFSSIFSPESIFKIQSDTILEIAEAESCIIVGRCADYVLRDNPFAFNFFIHSPMETRVERITVRNRIEKKDAGELMEKIDKARAAYYDFYTDKKWGESMSYHLSIDSSVLDIEGTAGFIADFVRNAVEARKKEL